MNSLRRMLDILDLFGPEQPVIDVETICTRLGYAPASAYRYVRELGDVGLLVRLPRGYALGPRVIELDRQMSEYNPVIVHSRDLLQHLVDETGMNALLSELYGDTVITLLLLSGSEAQALQFGRGRPMHLFRSATARIILAHLSPRQLRRIYDQHAHEPDMQRLGATWREFSKGMLELRRQGYCITHGELDEGKVGLAAPIFDEKQRVLGGITLVGSEARFAAYQQTYLAGLVTEAARELTRRIGNQ